MDTVRVMDIVHRQEEAADITVVVEITTVVANRMAAEITMVAEARMAAIMVGVDKKQQLAIGDQVKWAGSKSCRPFFLLIS